MFLSKQAEMCANEKSNKVESQILQFAGTYPD